MKVSELDYSKLTEEEKYMLVMHGINDLAKQNPTSETKADLIVVLGCSPRPLEARVKKMMELYKMDYSRNIHLSGGNGWQKLYKKIDSKTGQTIIDEAKRTELLGAIKDVISADLLGDNPSQKEIELYDRFVQGMNDMMQKNHVMSYEERQEKKKSEMTETEFMKLIILTNGGLPGARFLHEPFSYNTKENMQYTKVLIDDSIRRGELEKLNRLIVVTSSFHCKRAELTFKKYFPNVQVVSCPATLDLERRGIQLGEDMLNNPYYKEQIEKECNAIINYSRNKSIADVNLEEIISDEKMIESLEKKRFEIEI